MNAGEWARLEREIISCVRCPRLVEYRQEVARVRRRAFRDQVYWGRPVPGFGDGRARIVFVGLAPAAHGANRTGRMFTGDRSGDFLCDAMYRAGFATRRTSRSRDDGLRLRGAFLTAACRCAPPANRPTAEELANCAPYLERELELLTTTRVIVALGKVAWDAVLRRAARLDREKLPRRRPAFGHGEAVKVPVGPGGRSLRLLGTYHPSQQNTQTGRLTREMFDAVLRRARRLALSGGAPG